jgi:hypothetical protein
MDSSSKILTTDQINDFFSGDQSFKSQTRRLYDVANVLKSLGIIQKIKVNDDSKLKNAFQWIGSKGFNLVEQNNPTVQNIVQKL